MRNYWFTAFAIILCFLTNPTKDEFKTWSIQQGNNMKAADSAEAAKMAMLSTFALMFLDSAVIRSNYVVFSTYTSSANDQCLFVGVLGNFFDLSKDPIRPAEKPLEPSPSEIAPPISETVDSVNPSSLIQQQLGHVTSTISPVATETQVEVIIADFLAKRNMSLPTIQDVPEPTEEKYAPLSGLSLKERLANVVNADGDDFAIKCVDFNGDGVKDVFVEVKEGEKRFALYFFDGIKRTFEPITFSWKIQGLLSAPTQYTEFAYLLYFCNDDKQFLVCYIGWWCPKRTHNA